MGGHGAVGLQTTLGQYICPQNKLDGANTHLSTHTCGSIRTQAGKLTQRACRYNVMPIRDDHLSRPSPREPERRHLHMLNIHSRHPVALWEGVRGGH